MQTTPSDTSPHHRLVVRGAIFLLALTLLLVVTLIEATGGTTSVTDSSPFTAGGVGTAKLA